MLTLQRRTKICLLLAGFTFFWSWQIVQPVFDQWLPWIAVGHSNLSLKLPLSEALSQYLGAATLLSAYTLYSTASHGELTFGMNVAFLLAAFMVASGHGVHVASVTIQKQMSKGEPLYELVYFLHEHWSHNNLLVGFYGLVLLLIWAERRGAMNQLHKPPAKQSMVVNGSTSYYGTLQSDATNQRQYKGRHGTSCKECAQKQQSQLLDCNTRGTCNPLLFATEVQPVDQSIESTCTRARHECKNGFDVAKILPTSLNHAHKPRLPSHRLPEESDCSATGTSQLDTLSRCIVLWTTRVWPLFIGVYFSVFASMTSTKPLTTLFYIAILSSQMSLYKKLSFAGVSDYLKLCDNRMVISGFFTKAVLVGLPLILLDFE